MADKRNGISLSSKSTIDSEIGYGQNDSYDTSIGLDNDMIDNNYSNSNNKISNASNMKQYFNEMIDDNIEVMDKKSNKIIGDRETEYQRRRVRVLSPERTDIFSNKTPAPNQRTFAVFIIINIF